MKAAFVFPGQGSQSVGMLASLASVAPVVRETFAQASAVLGYDLWELSQSGPEASLNETERTQPALLAAGVATWRAWQARGGRDADVMAGHSLGEISALVCAGSLDFEEAVALVQFRGRVMQEAVPQGVGAMAAVLGLEDAGVEAACTEAARGQVVLAVNYNSPGQVVIAGDAAAVARAGEACQARGAKRVVPLPISVPCHSPLLREAAGRLRDRLDQVDIHAPRIPVYTYEGGWHETPEGIRHGLYLQLFSPVRWSTIVAKMIAAGTTHVVEAGPGKVLAGLVRRVEGGRRLVVFTLDGADSLDKALEGLAGGAA